MFVDNALLAEVFGMLGHVVRATVMVDLATQQLRGCVQRGHVASSLTLSSSDDDALVNQYTANAGLAVFLWVSLLV